MFSPNMLKTFYSCPQKYKYQYINQISVPQKTSFFEKGKRIHALANYYLRGDDITKLEKSLSKEEQNIWETLKNNKFFQMEYVNSEYNVSCKIDEYWIGGRLDALVKDNENYYILDYKTGSIPKNPEYDFQTIVYLLCLNKKFKNYNIKFVYIDLKNNKNNIIEFDESKSSEYQNRIIQTCKTIESYNFQKEIEKSESCRFCEYNKFCN